MRKQNLSRRAFIGLGAVAAAAASAGMAGCAPTTAASSCRRRTVGNAGRKRLHPFVHDTSEAPTDIKEEKECDVLESASESQDLPPQAAAETGVHVIGIDKQSELCVIADAGDFGVVESRIQKELGIEWAPKSEIVNQLMKDMCYRPNPDFLGYWYDHSGEDFDCISKGQITRCCPPHGRTCRPTRRTTFGRNASPFGGV